MLRLFIKLSPMKSEVLRPGHGPMPALGFTSILTSAALILEASGHVTEQDLEPRNPIPFFHLLFLFFIQQTQIEYLLSVRLSTRPWEST